MVLFFSIFLIVLLIYLMVKCNVFLFYVVLFWIVVVVLIIYLVFFVIDVFIISVKIVLVVVDVLMFVMVIFGVIFFNCFLEVFGVINILCKWLGNINLNFVV